MDKKTAKRLLAEIIILIIILIIWVTRTNNAYKIRIYFMKMRLLNKPYSVVTLNNRRKIKGKIIKENDKSLTLMVDAGEAVINKADRKNITAEAPAPK
jgi:hypothetical protein